MRRHKVAKVIEDVKPEKENTVDKDISDTDEGREYGTRKQKAEQEMSEGKLLQLQQLR